MLPPAGGGGAAGAWQPGMGMRAVARTHLVLGFAAAAFALYAVTLNPADFHTQIEQATQAGQGQCAATAAQAVELRAGALLLVLTGAAQAVAAAAADVAVATAAAVAPGSSSSVVAGPGRLLTFAAQLLGALNAYYLYHAVRGVATVAVGRCLGYYYRVALVICHVFVAVPFCLLLAAGLVVVLCGV